MVETSKSFIETVDNVTLVKGGPSSSKVLNDMSDRLKHDLVRLDGEVARVGREVGLTNAYLSMSGPALQALANHLASIIPSAPTKRGRLDLFDATPWTGTSTISTTYGQATLPILSTEDKIIYSDSDGNRWVPDDSRIRFFTSATYGGNLPGDDEFLGSVEDYKGLRGGISDFMLGSNLTSESYVFLKLIFPQGLNTSTLSNRLQCTILPMFKHSLVGAHLRRTDGEWTTTNIDYLPGYASSVVPLAGPLQLHFSPLEIRQVCLVFKGIGWWGVRDYSAQLVEYGSSSSLVGEFSAFSPGTIKSTTLYGNDTIGLTRLSPVASGTQVTIPLTQSAAYTSPVITGAEIRWA